MNIDPVLLVLGLVGVVWLITVIGEIKSGK